MPGVFDKNPFPSIVNGQLWTVPFELKCYAVLSVLSLLGIVRRKWLLLIAVLAAQIYIARHLVDHPAKGNPEGVQVMTGNMLVCCFLYGLAFHEFRKSIPYNKWLFAGSIVLAIACLSTPWTFHVAYIFICDATVYLGLLNPAKHAIVAKGDFSYGLYLYGFPIQQMVASLGSFTHVWYVNFVLSMICAGALAYLSWTFIEKPVLKQRTFLFWLEAQFLEAKAQLFRRRAPAGL